MATKSVGHISRIAEAKAMSIFNFHRPCLISFQEVALIHREWKWLFMFVKDYPAYTSTSLRNLATLPEEKGQALSLPVF